MMASVDRAAVVVARDSVRAWRAVWPALRAELDAARAELDALVAPLDAGELDALLERIRREALDVDGVILAVDFGGSAAGDRAKDRADFAALEARLCLAAFDALLERVLADGQRLDAVMREVARGR